MVSSNTKRLVLAPISGLIIGILGGLIGLGGAEFRLPLLIGLFGFLALPAVIMNKAMSLVVVGSALVFRAKVVPIDEVAAHWTIILNLLAGSLLGAWLGADWATQMKPRTLCRVLSALLLFISLVLVWEHHPQASHAMLTGWTQRLAGIIAGFGVGIFASLMGVAGGELLIPTLILLFGVNIKLAGSLSLAVSLPTMLFGFTRYSRDSNFSILRQNWIFLAMMACGSLFGAAIGGRLLGIVPASVLLPILAATLLLSAFKVWRSQ